MTSNIFKNYLNSVKHGNFSSHSIRTNLSVHSFCVQTLQSLRIIHVNKNCLSEEILIAFTTQTDDNSLNDIESNELIKYDRLTRRKKQLDQEPSSLYHFLIYYSDLIENLFHFLKEESVKIEESSAALNRITFMSSKTLNSFKNLLKEFKINIFLLNNYDFIRHFFINSNMTELNQRFETNIEMKIE